MPVFLKYTTTKWIVLKTTDKVCKAPNYEYVDRIIKS